MLREAAEPLREVEAPLVRTAEELLRETPLGEVRETELPLLRETPLLPRADEPVP